MATRAVRMVNKLALMLHSRSQKPLLTAPGARLTMLPPTRSYRPRPVGKTVVKKTSFVPSKASASAHRGSGGGKSTAPGQHRAASRTPFGRPVPRDVVALRGTPRILTSTKADAPAVAQPPSLTPPPINPAPVAAPTPIAATAAPAMTLDAPPLPAAAPASARPAPQPEMPPAIPEVESTPSVAAPQTNEPAPVTAPPPATDVASTPVSDAATAETPPAIPQPAPAVGGEIAPVAEATAPSGPHKLYIWQWWSRG